MPAFEGKCEHNAHSLEANDWREDLIEVNSFSLGKTFGYKSSLLSIICFDVEDPSVFNRFAIMRELSELEDIASLKCF